MNIDVLIPEVSNHLTGTPAPVIKTYLKRAAKQFCTDSGVWEHRTATKSVAYTDLPTDEDDPYIVTLPETGDEAVFTIPAGSYIQSVENVEIDKRSVRPDVGSDPFYYSYEMQALSIDRDALPAQDFKLRITVKLQPTKQSSDIPDFLIELHSEGIASYAIAEMMVMPETSWSNPQLAAVYRDKYRSRVAEARVQKAREGTTGRIAIQPFPFN